MHKKSKQNAIRQGQNQSQKKIVKLKSDPSYVDVLSEDKPISGQKFGCFSFLSPEKILKGGIMLNL
jgi:hypothetical protein